MKLKNVQRYAIAAAMLACVGTAAMSVVERGEYANLTREQQLRVARPLGNAGDPEIRDTQVVPGR